MTRIELQNKLKSPCYKPYVTIKLTSSNKDLLNEYNRITCLLDRKRQQLLLILIPLLPFILTYFVVCVITAILTGTLKTYHRCRDIMTSQPNAKVPVSFRILQLIH